MTALHRQYTDSEVAACVADATGRGVELVAGSITDMAGVTRGKYVPVRRLGAFHRAGMGASPSWSVFCVDSAIAFTSSLGVTGDLRIRIAPDDIRVVDEGIGWAPGELHDQDGVASTMCPRALLARIVDEARADGRTALVGAELECTVLAADGSHATTAPWSPYGMRTSLDRAGFMRDVVQGAERAGLVIDQLHTEYGHDQLEISLAPSGPVAAADDVVLARLVLGRAAARHGLAVSFAPVAFVGDAGNGAHLHLSMTDREGPLFSGGSGPHGIRPEGQAALAGVLDTLGDLMGVYAGSALSAMRLQPGSWSGAAACWGLENREAAVRFIAATPGNPGGANVELKVVDPSANPYLAVAGMLASALRGIRHDLRLPPEVTDNPADLDLDLPPLPTTQVAAVDRLAGSQVAAELFGADIVEGVVAVRRHEIATYGARDPADVAQALRLAWTC